MSRIALVLPLFVLGFAVAAPVPKETDKLKPATEKEREEVQNHLKQIVLAMHAYHDTIGFFPQDIVDAKTGKPLLSWRVHLLPYLDEALLYQSFKLNEPWDSDNNKKLIEKLPKVFAPTRVKAKAGETFYRGFGGKGENAGMFESGAEIRFASIADGSSNTIAVIDAAEPVIWTKPGTNLPVDPKGKLSKLGGMIDGNFYCGMCDGSVKLVKLDYDETALRAFISRAGGEVTSEEKVFVEK